MIIPINRHFFNITKKVKIDFLKDMPICENLINFIYLSLRDQLLYDYKRISIILLINKIRLTKFHQPFILHYFFVVWLRFIINILLISSLFVAMIHEIRYLSTTLYHIDFILSISILLRETMPMCSPRPRLPHHTMSGSNIKVSATE